MNIREREGEDISRRRFSAASVVLLKAAGIPSVTHSLKKASCSGLGIFWSALRNVELSGYKSIRLSASCVAVNAFKFSLLRSAAGQ